MIVVVVVVAVVVVAVVVVVAAVVVVVVVVVGNCHVSIQLRINTTTDYYGFVFCSCLLALERWVLLVSVRGLPL